MLLIDIEEFLGEAVYTPEDPSEYRIEGISLSLTDGKKEVVFLLTDLWDGEEHFIGVEELKEYRFSDTDEPVLPEEEEEEDETDSEPGSADICTE